MPLSLIVFVAASYVIWKEREAVETRQLINEAFRQIGELAVQTQTYQEGAIRQDADQDGEIENNSDRIDELFQRL